MRILLRQPLPPATSVRDSMDGVDLDTLLSAGWCREPDDPDTGSIRLVSADAQQRLTVAKHGVALAERAPGPVPKWKPAKVFAHVNEALAKAASIRGGPAAGQTSMFGGQQVVEVAAHSRTTASGKVVQVAAHEEHRQAAAPKPLSADVLQHIGRAKVHEEAAAAHRAAAEQGSGRMSFAGQEHIAAAKAHDNAQEANARAARVLQDKRPHSEDNVAEAAKKSAKAHARSAEAESAIGDQNDPGGFKRKLAASSPGNWRPIVENYSGDPAQQTKLAAWLDKYAATREDAQNLLDGYDNAAEHGIRNLDEIARRMDFKPIAKPVVRGGAAASVPAEKEQRRVAAEAREALRQQAVDVLDTLGSAHIHGMGKVIGQQVQLGAREHARTGTDAFDDPGVIPEAADAAAMALVQAKADRDKALDAGEVPKAVHAKLEHAARNLIHVLDRGDEQVRFQVAPNLDSQPLVDTQAALLRHQHDLADMARMMPESMTSGDHDRRHGGTFIDAAHTGKHGLIKYPRNYADRVSKFLASAADAAKRDHGARAAHATILAHAAKHAAEVAAHPAVKPIRKGLRILFRLFKGGEGSRGGKVIGHTRSGKPIYAPNPYSSLGHTEAGYSSEDHADAADVHSATARQLRERATKFKTPTARGAATADATGHESRALAHRQHSDPNFVPDHRTMAGPIRKAFGAGGTAPNPVPSPNAGIPKPPMGGGAGGKPGGGQQGGAAAAPSTLGANPQQATGVAGIAPQAAASPLLGRRVKFRHPITGEEKTGRVHAAGELGATVADEETGELHKVPHGGFVAHDQQKPAKPDAAPAGPPPVDGAAVGAAKTEQAQHLGKLHATAQNLPAAKNEARKDLAMGPESRHAHRAAAFLMAAHTGESPHDLKAGDVKVDGDTVEARGKAAVDPHLAAFMGRALHGRGKNEPALGPKGQPLDKQAVDDAVGERTDGGSVDDLRKLRSTTAWARHAKAAGEVDEKKRDKHDATVAESAGVDINDVDPSVRAAHHAGDQIDDGDNDQAGASLLDRAMRRSSAGAAPPPVM